MPEFLNRWATMTPDEYVRHEERRAMIVAALHKGDFEMNAAKIGPREQALRDMRREDTPLNLPKKKAAASAVAKTLKETAMDLNSGNSTPSDPTPVKGRDPSPELAEMVTAAIGRAPENAPKPKASAKANTTKEKTVKTKKAAPAKKGATKKAKVSAKKPAKAKAARSGARAAKVEGVRPGTKLETIVGLLKRPGGCTAKEAMQACDWPSVSMPQQAKAAGLKLRKEKVGGVTRYSAG